MGSIAERPLFFDMPANSTINVNGSECVVVKNTG
jgi:hypothetical protein